MNFVTEERSNSKYMTSQQKSRRKRDLACARREDGRREPPLLFTYGYRPIDNLSRQAIDVDVLSTSLIDSDYTCPDYLSSAITNCPDKLSRSINKGEYMGRFSATVA